MNIPISKEKKSKSILEGGDIKLTPLEKTYEKILKERNPASTTNRTLKSTKEIIESIAMIRDLISANSVLREKIESLKDHIEKQ